MKFIRLQKQGIFVNKDKGIFSKFSNSFYYSEDSEKELEKNQGVKKFKKSEEDIFEDFIDEDDKE